MTNNLRFALVGNPNSGKTSLFNAISGGHEHVGNYSGVTVDANVVVDFYGFIDMVDLMGGIEIELTEKEAEKFHFFKPDDFIKVPIPA